jgi:hypothetical protein
MKSNLSAINNNLKVNKPSRVSTNKKITTKDKSNIQWFKNAITENKTKLIKLRRDNPDLYKRTIKLFKKKYNIK